MPDTTVISQPALPLSESYYYGGQGAPLSDATIGQHLKNIVDKFPGSDAIVVRHQNVRWSYAMLWEQVEKVATGLLALGVQPGDRVGIWSPNTIEWSLIQYATARMGAIMVCLNPAYRPHELEFAINNVGVKYLVMAESFKSSDYVQMVNELVPELTSSNFSGSVRLPSLQQVIITSDTPHTGMLPFSALTEMGTSTQLNQLLKIEDTLKASEPVNIQFTSGTTGNPKGATLSHYNILNNGLLVARAMKFTEADRLCIPGAPVPLLWHGTGQSGVYGCGGLCGISVSRV